MKEFIVSNKEPVATSAGKRAPPLKATIRRHLDRLACERSVR